MAVAARCLESRALGPPPVSFACHPLGEGALYLPLTALLPMPVQNLLQVGSALLDISNKRHWDLIQQTEGGTAWLLKHYEDYASALAQNMRKTYLSPFTIITPNIGEHRRLCRGDVCMV